MSIPRATLRGMIRWNWLKLHWVNFAVFVWFLVSFNNSIAMHSKVYETRLDGLAHGTVIVLPPR